MTAIDSDTVPRRWLRLLPAALFAASVALGSAAAANAAPQREWDIDEYQRCMDNIDWDNSTFDQARLAALNCCSASDGDIASNGWDCVAPPAKPAQSQGQQAPQAPPPVGVSKPPPPPPRVNVTPTTPPAPVKAR